MFIFWIFPLDDENDEAEGMEESGEDDGDDDAPLMIPSRTTPQVGGRSAPRGDIDGQSRRSTSGTSSSKRPCIPPSVRVRNAQVIFNFRNILHSSSMEIPTSIPSPGPFFIFPFYSP